MKFPFIFSTGMKRELFGAPGLVRLIGGLVPHIINQGLIHRIRCKKVNSYESSSSGVDGMILNGPRRRLVEVRVN